MMIWCIEDDKNIREIILYTLQSTGFEGRGFEDGASFFQALQKEMPDLILLDIMLPGIDGIEILKTLQADPATQDLPVIMTTAKGQEYDKIKSLDLGADDYLVKPYGLMEMVSRIKAVLRRCSRNQDHELLKAGSIEMDVHKHLVSIEGKEVALTYKEYEILKLFLSHPGLVLTREQLMNTVWGLDYIAESRTVDMHIRTLRQKMGECSSMIQTIRNVGYRLDVQMA